VFSARIIIVGYDGSESSVRALDRATELATYGSRIVVAHVVVPGSQELAGEVLDEADEHLEHRHVISERRVLTGAPAEQLMELARELNAGLIVVGNGKSTLERILAGSVSSAIIHHAPCDVLVVR